jgi:uncharacterized membrane protein YfcA
MPVADFLPTALVVIAIGALIGAAGIGGVLLAPWLAHATGMTVHQAAGVAMLAFIGPGLVALAAARGAGSSGGRALAAWTLPGALAGSVLLAWLPDRVALLVLAAGVTLAGVRMLRPRTATTRDAAAPASPAPPAPPAGRRAAAPIGLVTGFASALTATSGPLVLTPLLLWRGAAVPDAIALGQLVQLPIATSASAVQLAAGGVPVGAGLAIGALLVPGVLIGRRVGDRLSHALLSRLVGVLLLVAALALIAKAAR